MKAHSSILLFMFALFFFPCEGANAATPHKKTSLSLTAQVNARRDVRAAKIIVRKPVRKAPSSAPSRMPFLLPSGGASVSSSSATVFGPVREEVLTLVNAERARAGLGLLRFHPLLHKAAQSHAEDMAQRRFFSHRNPDGAESFDRIKAAGYIVAPCNCAWGYWTGENIAYGQNTPAEVMKNWMNSSRHRANILSPNFDEIGIGLSGDHWVQNFGKIDP
ncbi:hypothetical protein A3D88_01790 [Candidatus Peribacteria bacterium RIFCSPHIGHO2_02_FULL_52_16]|nr:MAG: hypothetical protein A2706_04985 [Candidatus Peribacteria bacterium RIFCSPHIGHO2_01_FULL_51_35]OGJ61120.1 MAG: hypothetical protein A3D88_01790 [Candidatus Peribacteria bacterium RIFCSPHIGHO2_02_FULL_52_16]